jgi:hypothetical protein
MSRNKRFKNLKATNNTTAATLGIKRKDGYINTIVPKSIARARADIALWNTALKNASNVTSPKRVKLYNLYSEIMLDALLTSQIENRRQSTLAASFTIKDTSGTINEEVTALVKSAKWAADITTHILDTAYYGHSLIELLNDDTGLKASLINRNNVKPELGIFVTDETNENGIDYRNAKEYGTWLLEIGSKDNYGLLNKAIPHILFKRFTQSCWSELCEIYGMPPRVMHTNTQDPLMLSRAESMMKDMGAAAWFIIDESEKFEFASPATTNGDVYKNLITLCNNEISLLISGAVIGQDTVNGNESKEKASIEILNKLVDADKRLVESYWNTVVLPALFKIGILPDGLKFEFLPEENIPAFFKMVTDILPYKDVSNDFIKEKFGIEVMDKATPTLPPNTESKKLEAESFFD